MTTRKHRFPLVVYGPIGCGKTTNANRIAKVFGVTTVIDDWDGKSSLYRPGADTLALTHVPPPYGGRYDFITFEEAMKEVERAAFPALESAVMRASYVYVPDAEELAARLRAEAASYSGSRLLPGDLARAADLVELLARHEPIASLLYLVDLHEKIMRTAPTEAQRIAAAVRKAYKVVRLADHHGIRLEGLESARRLVQEFDRSLAESGQAPR